jgi:phage terminase small subunit
MTIEELRRDFGLSERQAAFALEYVIDLNGKQAAIRAKYKPSSADVMASRQLSKVNVQAAVAKLQAERSTRCQISADAVLRQYQRLAWSDPRKLFDAAGKPKPIHELDDDTAAALAGFEVSVDDDGHRTLKVKWADKKMALDSVAKHLGMFDGHGDAEGVGIKVVNKVYVNFDPEKDVKT